MGIACAKTIPSPARYLQRRSWITGPIVQCRPKQVELTLPFVKFGLNRSGADDALFTVVVQMLSLAHSRALGCGN